MKDQRSARHERRGLLGLMATSTAMLWGACVQASDDPQQDSPLTLAIQPQRLQAAPAGDEDWQLVIRLGFWGMSLDGTVGTQTNNADVSMDLDQIIDDLNWGGHARCGGLQGPLGPGLQWSGRPA